MQCPLLLACCYGAINRFAELDDLIGRLDLGGALPIADLARWLLAAGVSLTVGNRFFFGRLLLYKLSNCTLYLLAAIGG